jgi:uncharacterized protein with HEPN domain
MSRHESAVRLLDMLEHSREALAMINGKTRFDLDNDRKLNLALIHGYDFVDFDILWQILNDDLPRLIAKLEKIVQ